MKLQQVAYVFAAMTLGSLARAQDQQTTPTFEVASVKLNKIIDARRDGTLQPGRFMQKATSLRSLIRMAYNRPFGGREVVGGPDWVDSARFDVDARGSFQLADFMPRPDGSAGLVYQMLQSLLEDRFKLLVRVETRDQPIYALRVANGDGRLGPQLKRSDVDCDAVLGEFAKTGKWRTPSELGKGPPCSSGGTPGHIRIEDLSMSQLAAVLSGPANRVVRDQSGLSGNFDLTLDYTPDELTVQAGSISLFTALQEQLGLKLEPMRGPVEVLVIDHVEQPTPD
jgi:uncharacterized protein (TIGR03435 family)